MMHFIRNNVKMLLIVLITAIVVSSVSVYATISFSANQIGYNGSTVEHALNNLYDKVNTSKIYYLGQWSNFDLKILLPDIDYTELTAENFIVQVDSMSKSQSAATVQSTSGYSSYAYSAISNGATLSKTYNSSTGIFSCSMNLLVKARVTWNNLGQIREQSTTSTGTYSVWLILDDVNSVNVNDWNV